jgi:hypothetical protein
MGCRFLDKLPREVRDQIYEYVVGEHQEPNDGLDQSSIQPDHKFIQSICQTNKQIYKEALQVMLETFTIVLRSGRAMFHFNAFIIAHGLLDNI